MTLLIAFLAYTAAKLVTAVILLRRTRWWWAPGAGVLALGLGLAIANGPGSGASVAGVLVGLGAVGLAASRWLHDRGLDVYG